MKTGQVVMIKKNKEDTTFIVLFFVFYPQQMCAMY